MEPVPRPSCIVKFGVFEVDLEAGELRKSGMRQKLAGHPFQVLQYLLEHPQEIVTREQLQQYIWPHDTFIDYDLALKKAVNRIREVLGDSAESPRFIETIPRRGYRFIAQLNGNGDMGARAELPSDVNAREKPRSGRNLRIGIAVGVGVTALLVAILALVPYDSLRQRPVKTAVPQIRSLAVLPLENLSSDPAQEYFSEGMTDGLITELARVGSLKVISRTSSTQYKQTKKSLPEIASELNVDGIVEGTVQRSGDRVRITAQLIDARTDRHLWASTYERDMADVFALERQVAGDIAHEVLVHVSAQNQPPFPPSRLVNPQALEEYLQGNFHLNQFSRGFGDQELKLASNHFQRAIDADPNFALAYVGISNAHSLTLQSTNEDLELATKATEKALQLDPTLSDAWDSLGGIKRDSWDWAEAEQDFRRAIELNPNSVQAHADLANLLDVLGRLGEGWKEIQIAQQLDPNHEHLDYALHKRHEYSLAVEANRRMLGNDPNNGYLHHQLYENYVGMGMYKEAVEQLEQSATLFGFTKVAANLRRAYAASGYIGAMRQHAKELEHLQATKQVSLPINTAAVYAALGDKDRAFYWLEEGYKLRGHNSAGVGFTEVGVYPGLDPLRSDPRFADLLHRMGLPEVRGDESRRTTAITGSASVGQ